MERTARKTRWPGIYKVTRQGGPAGFLVSYRIPGVGQRTKTLPTLGAAKTFQATVRDPAKARQLRAVESGRVTLADYFDLFLERRRKLAPSTRARYEGIGRNYIQRGRLARMLLSSITRDDVEAWISDMERAGIGAHRIGHAYRVLRAAFGAAELDGKVVTNPAKRIATPEGPRREPFFLSADQVDAVAQEVPDRHRALVYFLAYTGVRIGEAAALRVRDIDFGRRLASISQNSVEVGGRLVSGRTKTRKVRPVDLSEKLCMELARHLTQFGPMKEGIIDPNGYIFSHRAGGQVRQGNWLHRVFQPACRRAGLVRLRTDGKVETPRVHDLRHTAASLAAKSGYSLVEVQQMLGHSTITTTANAYLHLFSDDRRQKADRLGALMSAAERNRTPGEVVPLRA